MSNDQTSELPWYRTTLAIALLGSLLLWAALPPLALGWLGWIAPVPWLILIRQNVLPGRRPYRSLYLAGLAFWLMTIHWLRLPHPAVYLGWFALGGYLAFYLPVFVGLSRVGVHRVGLPLWVAAPVVWTGLELARAHLLTGFLMASLAHTQVKWLAVIQVSDLVGEYGVDFLIMLVASSFACVVSQPRRWLPLAPAALAVAATLIYGHARLDDARYVESNADRTARIALIQGNSLAEWKLDPSRERQIMDEYLRLSESAVAMAKRDGLPLDLIVWPETMFRAGLVTFDEGFQMPAGAANSKEEVAEYGPNELAALVARLQTPVLVGIDRAHYYTAGSGSDLPQAERFNSAALVALSGALVGTYDKNHRVMFGEYIPFAKYLPFLYRITPLTGGIEAGSEPVVFELNDRRYAPSICYETVIPHVMRRQALARSESGNPADVLVNMTNDAWYWGSSELDQHLACGVFRAVETRRPLVIAANGGLSAWIDRTGRVRAQSQRQAPDVIIANVEIGAMESWYVRWGDWFAAVCLTASIALAIVGGLARWSRAAPDPSP